MDKKRILFITPSIYPQIVGGTEVFNYYLIQKLGNKYDISYLNVDANSSEVELNNAKRITIKNTSQIFQLFQIIFYLIKFRKSYDLIWTSFSRTAWYYIIIYPILNVLISKEYIIVIHGGGLMPWKWKFPYQIYFKKALAVIGVSDVICAEYKKRTGVSIIHIPPLVPFQVALGSKKELRDKYKINRNKKVFLYVGSLKELKRPDIIVKAFNILGKKYLTKQKILVVFAGDGILKNELIQYCQKEGLEDFFLFKGNVARDQVNEYYKMSDFYIISSDYEGTPISMLEAMFNKLPIIASNVLGINSVIDKERGILFDNKDVKSLTSAIEQLLDDNEFTKRISENSYNFFNKNYSYNRMINRYKKLI